MANVARTVVVPLEAAGRVFVVHAKIAQGPAVRLVVDTGAGTSALGESCANRLNLPLRRNLRVRTASGLGAVGTLSVRGLCVGPLELPSFRLAVVPLPDARVDGLLGLDFFRGIGASSLAVQLVDRPVLSVTLAPP